MKLLSTVASTVATLLLTNTAVEAKPFLYLSTFSYSGTYQTCISQAEEVLKKFNFEDFEYDKNNEKDRLVAISGYHKDEFMSIQIECDQKMGITSFGIAGLDNDTTYEYYKKIHDAEW